MPELLYGYMQSYNKKNASPPKLLRHSALFAYYNYIYTHVVKEGVFDGSQIYIYS